MTCQTDANGILFSDNATVSGGKVFVNGKPWAPTVSVSFDANGGTVSPKSRKVSKGAQLGALPKPTRKEFAFTGWWTKKSGGAQVSAATKASGSMTLYARWAKTTYNVKFAANGGKGTMSSQKMTYGKTAKLNANKFERDGCVFLGWAKTKNGALAYKNRQAVKNLTANGGDVTLYAQWSKKVAVKFNANGGTVKKNSKTAMTGKKLGSLPTPTRKNWTFDGWWTKKTGGKRVTASTAVKKAMTVYAHWTPIVTVTFDPNGGTVSKTKLKTRTYLYKGAFYLDTYAFPTPVRPHYAFGWNSWFTKKSGGIGCWDVSVKNPCSITLYAHWEPLYHDIWFSELNEYRSFRDGKPLGTLPSPTCEGYEFGGWFTGEHGKGRRINASTIANESLPREVYAHWVQIFTIDFVSNGEVVATKSMKVGDAFHDLPVPTNGGTWDKFDFWYSDVAEKTIKNGSIYDGSYQTLKAYWIIGAVPLSPTDGGWGPH